MVLLYNQIVMSVAAKFIFRVYPKINTSVFRFSNVKISTSMPLSTKYGKLINDNVSSAFYLPIGEGSDMAMVLYEQQKGTLVLHHTQVPEDLQGKGIGTDLAREVFEYCSARNLKVRLTCEFLQKFYEENPKYKDLVLVREKMNI